MSKPFSKLDSLREWKKSSQSWFPWFLKFRRPISSTKMEKSRHLIVQNAKILTDYLHTLVWCIQTSNQSGLSLFSTSASWFNHFRFPAEYQIQISSLRIALWTTTSSQRWQLARRNINISKFLGYMLLRRSVITSFVVRKYQLSMQYVGISSRWFIKPTIESIITD